MFQNQRDLFITVLRKIISEMEVIPESSIPKSRAFRTGIKKVYIHTCTFTTPRITSVEENNGEIPDGHKCQRNQYQGS